MLRWVDDFWLENQSYVEEYIIISLCFALLYDGPD
jgi:hypothetical protein